MRIIIGFLLFFFYWIFPVLIWSAISWSTPYEILHFLYTDQPGGLDSDGLGIVFHIVIWGTVSVYLSYYTVQELNPLFKKFYSKIKN